MATPRQPHADLDNEHLAAAMRANAEIRTLIERINNEAVSVSRLKTFLLNMTLAVARQNEALHQMNLIRQEHSRRLARNRE
jgi:hypothetical protein